MPVLNGREKEKIRKHLPGEEAEPPRRIRTRNARRESKCAGNRVRCGSVHGPMTTAPCPSGTGPEKRSAPRPSGLVLPCSRSKPIRQSRMMRADSSPASAELSAFPEGPGFPARTGSQTTEGRFHGISFSASSAAIPVPRVSGRLESLHFRGRSDRWAPERRPHSIVRLKAAAEIQPGGDFSCEDGIFAFELLRSAGLEPAR